MLVLPRYDGINLCVFQLTPAEMWRIIGTQDQWFVKWVLTLRCICIHSILWYSVLQFLKVVHISSYLSLSLYIYIIKKVCNKHTNYSTLFSKSISILPFLNMAYTWIFQVCVKIVPFENTNQKAGIVHTQKIEVYMYTHTSVAFICRERGRERESPCKQQTIQNLDYHQTFFFKQGIFNHAKMGFLLLSVVGFTNPEWRRKNKQNR